MKELKDGIRSEVYLDYKGRVHKKFRGTGAKERYLNEVKILKVLEERDCPNVPRVLEEHPDENYFVSTNCGSPAPGITKVKCNALFTELEQKYGVRHDDAEARNVTYSPHLGRFCLIDFELSTDVGLRKADKENKMVSTIEPASSIWRVRWVAESLKGRDHKANDDAWLALEVSPEGAMVLPSSGEFMPDPNHLVLAVSDGMGGHSAGEMASRLVLHWVRRHARELHRSFEENPDDLQALADLLKSAHLGINNLAEQENNLQGMGATLTLTWITRNSLYLAHIGDSRCYLSRNEQVQQLSEDHCMAWRQFKRGELAEVQYRQHPKRNVLYESLGNGHKTVIPQLHRESLQKEERIFLCSDGVTDGLWERQIAEGMIEKGDLKDIGRKLLTKAYDNAGRDDTTMILADISKING